MLQLNIKRDILQPFFWVSMFIISFRVLGRSPLGIIEEALFLGTLIVISVTVFGSIISGVLNGRINYLFLILIPLLIVPFINAYQANKVFQQPFLIGLVTQRQHYILLCGYFCFLALQRHWINLEQIEKYFIRSMYINMAVMIFFNVLIDPSVFKDTEFVKYSLNKGWQYEFPNAIAIAIIIYSIGKAWGENKPMAYLPLFICTAYFFIYGQDRSQIFFAVITIFIYYAFNLSTYKKIKYALGTILFVSFGISFLYIVFPDFVQHYFTIFGNASSIVTGEEVRESSTNIRFKESAIAMENFIKHPWLGNGSISAKFNGGFKGFFGYFYPGDIGILGNLFVYGIVGTIAFYIPFYFSLIWSLKMRKLKFGFLNLCIYGMLFTFLDMITAASNIKFIGLPIFYFSIIYYYRFYIYPFQSENEGLQSTS